MQIPLPLPSPGETRLRNRKLMKQPTIWHNARCSKSRATLALLEERGLEPQVISYLNDPPQADELKRVIEMLGLEPRGLMRTNEAVYRELGLADVTDDDALLDAMVNNPALIQRPVVISGNRAAIGRPPETVLEILE